MLKRNKIILSSLIIGGFSSLAYAKDEVLVCLACPVGTYSDGTKTSCVSCLTTGVASCDSLTGNATSCKAGYGYNSTNKTCSKCPSNTFSTGGTSACKGCSGDTFTVRGQPMCYKWQLVSTLGPGSHTMNLDANTQYKFEGKGGRGGKGSDTCTSNPGGQSGSCSKAQYRGRSGTDGCYDSASL